MDRSELLKMNSHCPISGETYEEERLNHWTHLIGVILSVIGLPILIVYSSLYGDFWHVASFSIYGLTLVLLYVASSYYHGCQTIALKEKLKLVDHACIYLLIAGSYTPFVLGPLRDSTGWLIFSIEWGIAIAGILFKLIAINRFEIVSLLAYLAMGWLVIFYWSSLVENLPLLSLALMISGGISYTLGTLFFVWDKLPFNHGIWHLFVLVGSALHYFAVISLLG